MLFKLSGYTDSTHIYHSKNVNNKYNINGNNNLDDSVESIKRLYLLPPNLDGDSVRTRHALGL